MMVNREGKISLFWDFDSLSIQSEVSSTKSRKPDCCYQCLKFIESLCKETWRCDSRRRIVLLRCCSVCRGKEEGVGGGAVVINRSTVRIFGTVEPDVLYLSSQILRRILRWRTYIISSRWQSERSIKKKKLLFVVTAREWKWKSSWGGLDMDLFYLFFFLLCFASWFLQIERVSVVSLWQTGLFVRREEVLRNKPGSYSPSELIGEKAPLKQADS